MASSAIFLPGWEQMQTSVSADPFRVGNKRGGPASGQSRPDVESMTARMTALATELDLIAFPLAVLAAVLPPFAVFLHGAAAGRMRTLVGVCHRNLLRKSLRLV